MNYSISETITWPSPSWARGDGPAAEAAMSIFGSTASIQEVRIRLQQVDRTMYNRVDVHSEFGCRKWWHVGGFQESKSKHKPASQWLFGIVTSNSYTLPHPGLFDSSRHRFKDCRSMRQVGASNFHEIRPCCCARVSMGWAKVLWIVDSAIASCEKAKKILYCRYSWHVAFQSSQLIV